MHRCLGSAFLTSDIAFEYSLIKITTVNIAKVLSNRITQVGTGSFPDTLLIKNVYIAILARPREADLNVRFMMLIVATRAVEVN